MWLTLPRSSTFEEVSFLLLNDRLPIREELKRFQSELISEREVPEVLFGVYEDVTQISPSHGCASGIDSHFGELRSPVA